MIRSKPIVIIQAGRPPEDLRALHGEQPDWFRAALADIGHRIEVVRPFAGEALPEAGSFSCAVITGSWSMVTDREDWSERTAEWIRRVLPADARLLGVCYGHQLMAHALGGDVGYHPAGREVGVRQIALTGAAALDPLLPPSPASFGAFLTHEQSILRLPEGATVLGSSEHDPHQIVRYSENALSVQFHPEFTPEIMRACIERRRENLTSEGLNVDGLLSVVQPGPTSIELLRSFCRVD